MTYTGAAGVTLLVSLLVALLTMPRGPSRPLTYYVSSSGSDTNSGLSRARPWRTLARVNRATLAPGDRVLFAGGETYVGELNPAHSGTAGHPVTFGSYGTGAAVLTHRGGAVNLRLRSVHDLTFTRLVFDGGGFPQRCVADAASGSGVQRVTFDDVEVRKCGAGQSDSAGIVAGNTHDAFWTVRGSYIHDTTGSGLVFTGPHHAPVGPGFRVETSRIERTGLEDPVALGWDAHGIYNDAPGIVIRRNDIGGFQTDGISLRVRDALVQDNTIHDGTRRTCCSAGVGYYNYDPTERAGEGTTTIRGNRVWNVPYGLLISNQGASPDCPSCLPGPENFRIDANTLIGGPGAGARTGAAVAFFRGVQTRLVIADNVITGRFAQGAQTDVRGTPAAYVNAHNHLGASVGFGAMPRVGNRTAAGRR